MAMVKDEGAHAMAFVWTGPTNYCGLSLQRALQLSNCCYDYIYMCDGVRACRLHCVSVASYT